MAEIGKNFLIINTNGDLVIFPRSPVGGTATADTLMH